jgi:hypothetical protein
VSLSSRTGTPRIRPDGAGRMLVVWLLFCCASIAPGNFPPALSRPCHRRATFQLALPSVFRSTSPEPGSADTALGESAESSGLEAFKAQGRLPFSRSAVSPAGVPVRGFARQHAMAPNRGHVRCCQTSFISVHLDQSSTSHVRNGTKAAFPRPTPESGSVWRLTRCHLQGKYSERDAPRNHCKSRGVGLENSAPHSPPPAAPSTQ